MERERERIMTSQAIAAESNGRSVWWSIALRGVLAILFGVIALARPRSTALALVILFAMWVFIDAICAFVAAARRGRAGMRWGWFLFEGIVSLAAGVVALTYPGITVLVLTIVVAVRAIVLGVLGLGAAIAGTGAPSRWLQAITGVVSLAFGFLLLWQPLIGALALVWSLGAYAIIVGIMTLAYGWHAHATGEEAPPAGLPRAAAAS
jgi:uncharacterized membrane protein HdeD (DUF308 family)